MRREHTRALVPCVRLCGEVVLVDSERYKGRDSGEVIRHTQAVQLQCGRDRGLL